MDIFLGFLLTFILLVGLFMPKNGVRLFILLSVTGSLTVTGIVYYLYLILDAVII